MCLIRMTLVENDATVSPTITGIPLLAFVSKRYVRCWLGRSVVGGAIFQSGTTHLVWVSGPGPLLRLQKLQLSHFPVGMARVQLLRTEARPPPPPPDAARLELRSRGVPVPDQETTYWCTVHRLPAALARKHHIIQARRRA